MSFSYLDNQYTCLGDTLLMYTGTESEPEVRAEILGNPVRRIGKGAFSGNNYVKKAVISEGIREICRGAFAGCRWLESVIIPSSMERIEPLNGSGVKFREAVFCAELSAAEYDLLPRNPKGGKQILRKKQIPGKVLELAEQLELTVSRLPEDFDILFSEEEVLDQPKKDLYYPEVWNCGCEETVESEREEIQRQILRYGEPAAGFSSRESEERSDWYSRVRGLLPVSNGMTKEAAAWYLGKETRESRDGVRMMIHFSKSYFFGVRVTPVRNSGKTRFVAARIYMRGAQRVLLDTAVLDGNGNLLENEKEAGEVYAKYRLPVLI